MKKLGSILKTAISLLVLVALALGAVWLLGVAHQGAPTAELSSPLATPTSPGKVTTSPPTATPTRENWAATATVWARITPSPFPIPPATPIGGLTPPTPAVGPPPPTMAPPKAFRAEYLEVADVRFVDFYAHFEFVGWSPDGTHILVEPHDPEHWKLHQRVPGMNSLLLGLWTMKADGTERRQVAEWATDSVTWSPDEKYIAYSVPAKEEGTEGEVYVADVETLKSWKVADSDFTPSLDIYWLPNGELTFLKDGHIFAVQADGKSIRQLNDIYIAPNTPKQLAPGLYKISPDGQRIAWTPGGKRELWISDLAGLHAKLITDKCYAPTRTTWSPDGKYLAFSADGRYGPVSSDLWVADADGSHPHPVATAEREWDFLAQPAWSPDGQVIAFARGAGSMDLSLWVVNRDGTALRRLGGKELGVVSTPWWSPTGTQVAYDRQRWEPSGLPNAAIITLKQEP